MKWKVIDSGSASPEQNMAIDAELLKSAGQMPILHLYEFEGAAATYGYFIRPFAHLNEERVKQKGLKLARRPTGGGIIFHLWDFTFSLLLPAAHPAYSRNPLDNYTAINGKVGQILSALCAKSPTLLKEKGCCSPFCMAKPTIYDLLLGGQKVGGAAQRSTKQGLLHQGSIALHPPEEDYLKDLLLDQEMIEKMQQNSGFIASDKTPLKELREKLKTLFIERITSWI